MKRTLFFIFFNCIFFGLFAQNSINQLNAKGEKTGPWEGFYNTSNNKRYKGSFSKDKPIGQFTYYAEKGHVSAEVNFINDSISSSVMYYDNGYVMAKGKFLNKKKVGKWSTYRKSGDLLNIFNYKNGVLEGSQYMYYPENKETKQVKLFEEYYCLNGLKHGVWKQYFELGRLKAKGQYSNGKKEGKFEYYFMNGNIDKKGNFSNNKKNGLWFFYNLDTENMDELIYKMGDIVKSKSKKGGG